MTVGRTSVVWLCGLDGWSRGWSQPRAGWALVRALRKRLEALYTTKVNNRDRSTSVSCGIHVEQPFGPHRHINRHTVLAKAVFILAQKLVFRARAGRPGAAAGAGQRTAFEIERENVCGERVRAGAAAHTNTAQKPSETHELRPPHNHATGAARACLRC